jgi:hypothetical protein
VIARCGDQPPSRDDPAASSRRDKGERRAALNSISASLKTAHFRDKTESYVNPRSPARWVHG